jgi:hypothetical protein
VILGSVQSETEGLRGSYREPAFTRHQGYFAAVYEAAWASESPSGRSGPACCQSVAPIVDAVIFEIVEPGST